MSLSLPLPPSRFSLFFCFLNLLGLYVLITAVLPLSFSCHFISAPVFHIRFYLQAHIRTFEGRIAETILSLRFFIFQYGIIYKLKVQGTNKSLAVRDSCISVKWYFIFFILHLAAFFNSYLLLTVSFCLTKYLFHLF